MEKIKNAAFALDNIGMEISVLRATSFILWDSMANGSSEISDVFKNFVFDLSNKTENLEAKYNAIVGLLFEGLREVKE